MKKRAAALVLALLMLLAPARLRHQGAGTDQGYRAPGTEHDYRPDCRRRGGIGFSSVTASQ